jgi:hypothetical protein
MPMDLDLGLSHGLLAIANGLEVGGQLRTVDLPDRPCPGGILRAVTGTASVLADRGEGCN